MDNLKEMEDIISHAHAKNALIEEKKELKDQVSNLLNSSITGLESDKDFMSEKLNAYDTAEELKEALQDDNLVESFFVTELGTPMKLLVSDENTTPERELQFKRDLLVYIKSTQEYNKKIDDAFKEKEEAEKEFNLEMTDCIRLLSDNFLIHVQTAEEALNNPNLTESERRKAQIRIDAIKSGYTFQHFINLLEKYPNMKDNLKSDFNNKTRRGEIVAKYAKKTHKETINPVLGSMLHNEGVSLERYFLTDDEYGTEGLMLFFMVKVFSIEGFKDTYRTLHSSLSLILRKMLKNDISQEFKDEVLVNMRKFAAALK